MNELHNLREEMQRFDDRTLPGYVIVPRVWLDRLATALDSQLLSIAAQAGQELDTIVKTKMDRVLCATLIQQKGLTNYVRDMNVVDGATHILVSHTTAARAIAMVVGGQTE